MAACPPEHFRATPAEIAGTDVALAPRAARSARRGSCGAGACGRCRGRRAGPSAESWIAIPGPAGPSGSQAAAVRAQARRLYRCSLDGSCAEAAVRSEGFAPPPPAPPPIARATAGGLIAQRPALTSALERVAARVMSEL